MSIQYPTTPGLSPTGNAYNDGSNVYGSAQLTITISGTSIGYDSNDFTPDFGSNRKENTNRFGVPNRAFALPTTPNGSCNIQIAASNALMPFPGCSFTADTTGTITWLIDKVGAMYKKDDYLFVSLNYSQKLN